MKVLFFANTDWFLHNFMTPLAKALRECHNEVVMVSPDGSFKQNLKEAGFRWVNFSLSRRGMNPFYELLTVFRLTKFYRQEEPDIVHHFTVKCVLYGSLAARFSRKKIRVVNTITGLGSIFIGRSVKLYIIQRVIKILYRIALHGTDVIFLNPEDRKMFVKEGMLDAENAFFVPGDGVDIDLFQPQREADGTPVVAFIGRMLWDKGVGELVKAADILQSEGVRLRFALIGISDPENPSAISESQLRTWEKRGKIEWWEWQNDMVEVFRKVHIVCLPSYREGMPRVLAEAGASGRAIIATDVPGCREIVQDGKNGILVPVRDVESLTKAIRELVEDPDLRQEMGRQGRSIVEERFSTGKVIKETMDVYHRTPGKETAANG